MRTLSILICTLILSGCAANKSWQVVSTQDEFTDQRSCKIDYDSGYIKDIRRKVNGGIHYYPFVEKVNNTVIFGVQGDYKIPVGDVQIRIDNNKAISISYTETPVFYSATSKAKVDISYLKSEGIDNKILQSNIDEMMANVQKISSPFTATSGDKARLIIDQMKKGKLLKMRVIGFGTNSVSSNSGEYLLGEKFVDALNRCNI